MKKTAREKLEVDNDLPKIKKALPNWGGGKMVIAHPTEFDALLKKVRKGSSPRPSKSFTKNIRRTSVAL